MPLNLKIADASLEFSGLTLSSINMPTIKAQKKVTQLTEKERPLSRLTLLRKIYRVLLNSGRTYAAFTFKEKKLVEALKEKGEILDPMSGYGSITKYCAEIGISSYCVEYNLPQFLWQSLCHPAHTRTFIAACHSILAQETRWPKSTSSAIASDDWFPEEAKSILLELFTQTERVMRQHVRSGKQSAHLSAALVLPFVGRLSSSVPGDIVTHVKKGGICVFEGWHEDYRLFLLAVIRSLELIESRSTSLRHVLVHGDARRVDLPERRFGALLTSPPYPNHRDFVSMFAPEHAFLDLLAIPGGITSRTASVDVIGSNFVAGRPSTPPTTNSARRFLKSIAAVGRNETAIRHDDQYYIPYFEHYFTDLEDAYANIKPSLKRSFEGYVVVVNNTHRNIVVPVSDVILEIWKRLGFKAKVFDSKEYFHVGTKNPRARGLRARHTEYVIRIWR